MFLDQLTKVLVELYIEVPGRTIAIIDRFDLLRLTFVKNTGAAWGILQGHRVLFVVVAVVVTAACIWVIQKFNRDVIKFPFALILGGGLGNMMDRLFLRSGVVDFLDAGVYSYRWPTFNIADIALTVGVAWIAYLIFIGSCPLEDYLFCEKQ